MSPRPRRHGAPVLVVLAVALLGAVGGALPAAASPSVTPISIPKVSITPADVVVEYPNNFTFTVTAATSDGHSLSGSLSVDWHTPQGKTESLYVGTASTFQAGITMSVFRSELGAQSITAKYSGTGIGAGASATANFSVKHFDASATLTVGASTTTTKTPVTVSVAMPDGTDGAGGTVTAKVDAGGPSATCTPVKTADRVAGCVAQLPSGLTAGSHTVTATYSGSPIFTDAKSSAVPFFVAAGTSQSGTSGGGSGSSGGSSAAPGSSASPDPSSSDSATPVAIAADPASDARDSGTDPLILVITTVGACAALGALGVAIYLLIRRRRTPAGPGGD